MSLKQRDEPLVERRNASRIEREFLPSTVADPQHDCMAAEVERKRERSVATRFGGENAEASRIRLKRRMPAVIHPRRMGDADLAEHLRGKVEERERLVIALDIQLWPVAHERGCSTPLHFA